MSILKTKVLAVLLSIMIMITGCQLLEGIFEAGFWVGLIAAAVLVLVIFIIVKIIKAISK
jgi:uncharacterized membrane protein YcjF (UPF0283 family)